MKVPPFLKLFPWISVFLAPAPAEPRQLAPHPSVQLLRRPVQRGESPGRRAGGPGGAGSGAGTPGGPTFSRALSPAARSCVSFSRAGRRRTESAHKVRLQSPQMSHSLGCWSSLFQSNLKVTVALTLVILLPL